MCCFRRWRVCERTDEHREEHEREEDERGEDAEGVCGAVYPAVFGVEHERGRVPVPYIRS
jgi:hypothetical protein